MASHLKSTDEINLGRFLSFASGDRVVKCQCVRVVVEPVDAIGLKVKAFGGRPVKLESEAVSIVVVVSNVLISSDPSFDVNSKPKTIEDPLPCR